MSTRSVRYSTFNRSIRKGNLASTDRDALAFLEAAQIYNTNQQRAIVNLVRSLKRVGLWSKMKAIYPFVGGTASSHKWNLKDPRDVDAAFRLTFSGGWTHSGTGVTPNGTNGFANTFFNGTNHTISNAHISIYAREDFTNTSVDLYPIGYYKTTTPFEYSAMDFYESSGKGIYASAAGDINQGTNHSVTSHKGYHISTVRSTASNDLKFFTNGVQAAQATNTNTSLLNGSYYLAALHRLPADSATNYFAKQIAFATIGDGLTDNDVTNLYNIVDLYQRRLGRNV